MPRPLAGGGQAPKGSWLLASVQCRGRIVDHWSRARRVGMFARIVERKSQRWRREARGVLRRVGASSFHFQKLRPAPEPGPPVNPTGSGLSTIQKTASDHLTTIRAF